MKKSYLIISITIFCLGYTLSSKAQNGKPDLWTSVSSLKAKQENQIFRKSNPIKESFFKLDLQRLKNEVSNVGLRFQGVASELIFPNVNGEMKRYLVSETPIMHKDLQSKYPEIRSYSGQGIDRPSETISFSITPKGFHGMILGTKNGTQFIDPYSEESNIYTVYAKSDLNNENKDFECGVIDPLLLDKEDIRDLARNANDGTLRDFRLALACTGEYATFHGGTIGSALAAMNVTMTRVNGIYKRDLSVTMTIIPTNTAIMFLSGATDPFNNDNANVLIGQSQTEIDARIGNANYDIGHTFSTGAGGLAALGSTCVDGSKAAGVTGLSQPIGDAFDIDFVAHEFGHQFGAPHTFNGTQGNCAGGNRTASNAYEPGSGTTIMAYAGICGSDNVQNNSDAYFHQKSLQMMWDHITSSGACPISAIATGNSTPTSEAGLNYTIPSGTPYKLTGSSTDADGTGSHTYTWEQYDLGPAGLPTETTFSGPLVRSFEGTDSPIRYIPRLPDLLFTGGSTTWEKLSTISRAINYRLTVRDNDTRGGQTAVDNMTANVIASAGPFLVTSQGTDQIVWTPGETETITWNVAGTTANGINTANVNILLSTDEGITFDTVLASNVPNDGSHDIIVPNITEPRCRIMVEGVGNIFFNLNNSFFAIGDYSYVSTEVCDDYLFNAGITIVENAGSYTGYGLNIPDSYTITDVDINVNITGPNNGDIFHAIRGPWQAMGVQQLANGVCPGTSNQNLTFDDEGNAVNCASTNNGDNVIPAQPLTFADGQNSAGDWIFFITDVNVDGTTSTLNTVTITVCRQETIPVLSVDEEVLENLAIYPNPNSGEFNVAFNPKSGEAITIDVYDIRGRAIYSKRYEATNRFEEVIRLNKAQSGVYLLNISDGSQKITKKIIVD